MALLFRCLMNVRAVVGEVDPPPLPGIDASTSSRRVEAAASGVSRTFAPQAARAPLPGGHELQEKRLAGFTRARS